MLVRASTCAGVSLKFTAEPALNSTAKPALTNTSIETTRGCRRVYKPIRNRKKERKAGVRVSPLEHKAKTNILVA